MTTASQTAKHRRYILKKYGCPWSFYDILKYQNFACAICQTQSNGDDLVIDHDHELALVRGLLCQRCNTGLGMFRNSQTLKFAEMYLAEGCYPDTLDYVHVRKERAA